MNNQNKQQQQAMEQLQTIKTFFEEGQKNLGDNGFHFMLWGLLIPLATVVFQLLPRWFGAEHIALIIFWPATALAGSIVSVIAGLRSAQRSRTKGYALRLNSLLWQGFLISMLVIFVVLFTSSRTVEPVLLSYIALLLGLAYWVHGAMIQLPWFRILALVWWLSAILMAFCEWPAAQLCMAGTTFLCSFIPGLFLHLKAASGVK